MVGGVAHPQQSGYPNGMQIVILDGHTLNPGDLSWDGISKLGDCFIHERSAPHEVVERIRDADIVLTNKVPLNSSHLRDAPKLRYIGVMATGYNIVDVAAAREKKITVTNVPDYGTPAVAQMVFALLLELAHRTGHHAQTVRDGRWSVSPDFCYYDFPLFELESKKLGLIGFGRIGHATAKIGQAFGMDVLVAKRPSVEPQNGITVLPLEEVMESSDVVSLHCPLTPETREMVNAARLKRMKRSAFLINTSRGPLVNEMDLANALNREELAGAGLDVLSIEPPPPGNPLFTAKNCYITPHIAWAAFAARQRMMRILVENLEEYLKGKPRNVVNP
jgi:glycerate dehydrogenase